MRPEPQVSSPVLTWISGFLWSFQGSQASSRVEICKSPFVSSFNSSVRLPAELTQGSVSFSQGATGLSHWPWCFESILRVTVESVQWNQFYQGWTGTWGSFGMVKRPLSSSRLSGGDRLLLSCQENVRILFLTKQEIGPSSRDEEGKIGLFLSCGGTLGVPLEWRRVCRGTS